MRRDKRWKKWVNHYFAFAFAGSDIDSRQPEGTPALSSLSRRRTAADGRARGLSFRARRNSNGRAVSLCKSAHANISFIKENIGGRASRARDLPFTWIIRCGALNCDCIFASSLSIGKY